MIKSESLQMRESSKRLLSFDRRREGEGKLDELSEHDALELDSGGTPVRRRCASDEHETSRLTSDSSNRRCRRREKVAVRNEGLSSAHRGGGERTDQM